LENKFCYINLNKVSYIGDIEEEGEFYFFRFIIDGCLIKLKYCNKESAVEAHNDLVESCRKGGFVPDLNCELPESTRRKII